MSEDDKNDEIIRLSTAFKLQSEELEQKDQFLQEATAKAKVYEDYIRKQTEYIRELSDETSSLKNINQQNDIRAETEIDSLKQEIERFEKTEKLLNERVGRSNEEIANLQNRVMEYQVALGRSENQVEELSKAHEQAQRTVVELRDQTKGHDSAKDRINDLQSKTQEKDSRIGRLSEKNFSVCSGLTFPRWMSANK